MVPPFAVWEVCSPCAGKVAVKRPTRQRCLCLQIATKTLVVNPSPGGYERRENAGEKDGEIERDIGTVYREGKRDRVRERLKGMREREK